jgi:hypothetical protein
VTTYRPGSRRLRPGKGWTTRVGTAAAIASLSFALSACATSRPQYYPTCVDSRTGAVLDPNACAVNPPPWVWVYMADRPYIYSAGGYQSINVTVLNSSVNSGRYFAYNNTTARSNAGLSKSGGLPPAGHAVTAKGGSIGASHAGKSGG